MSKAISLFKLFCSRGVMRKPPALSRSTVTFNEFRRNFADTPKRETSKQVMVHGTKDEARVRVRRARPADVPRVLRFVRENARLAWPGLVNAPHGPNQIVLSDYVARTLAQGHTMLAEQQIEKGAWSEIRGLALNTSVCPWDAAVLEKWARYLQCTRSRKLMLFTAHCLRAPELHDKYRVHNILQVILIVPTDTPRSAEIVQMLAKNSIQRGRELGFNLLRFDVTAHPVAEVLDNLQLKKEYEFNYEVMANAIKIYSFDINNREYERRLDKGKLITVYTAFPHAGTSLL